MLYTFNQFSEQEHANLAGGKGSMLAKLYKSGYPVPDGFVILSTAFDDHGLVDAAREKLLSHYNQLINSSPTGKVAVRSSALAEDSAKASYAGKFETILNIASETGLYAAIQAVFDSGKSESVKTYTDATGQSGTQTMAVVVQHMLDPSYAGVLFTADPISGDANILLGNLTEGLGDKLVSGKVNGRAFTYHMDTGTYHGPDYFEPYQRELLSMASKLVGECQFPQDIEWAVHQDRLFLLQSRPITHLSHTPEVWNDSLKGNYLWCNTNLGELFGNVITPFTWSIFREVVESNVGPVGGHFMVAMKVRITSLGGMLSVGCRMALSSSGASIHIDMDVGLVAGRSYFNISLVYSIFRKMGKQRRDILNSFDLFLGYVPDHIDIPVVPLSWSDCIGFMLRQTGHSLKSALGLNKFLVWAKEECPAWCESMFLAIEQSKNNSDLLRIHADI